MPLTSQGQYWSLSPNPDTHRNTQRGQESKANNLENGAQRQSTNAVEPCLLPHQPPGAKREPRDSTSGLLLSPTPTNGSCLFLGVRACLALVPSFSFLRWGSFPHKSFYYNPSQPETSGTDSAPLRAKVERTGEDWRGQSWAEVPRAHPTSLTYSAECSRLPRGGTRPQCQAELWVTQTRVRGVTRIQV